MLSGVPVRDLQQKHLHHRSHETCPLQLIRQIHAVMPAISKMFGSDRDQFAGVDRGMQGQKNLPVPRVSSPDLSQQNLLNTFTGNRQECWFDLDETSIRDEVYR